MRLIGHATKVPIACAIAIILSSWLGICNWALDSTTTSTLTFTLPWGSDLLWSVSIWIYTFPRAIRRSNDDDTYNLQGETPYMHGKTLTYEWIFEVN